MPTLTGPQCGDLLARWLVDACSPGLAKAIAKDVGFNDSPLFGAEKKKIRLMGELVIANSALGIFAVNQVFDAKDARSIIDPFLSAASRSVFEVLEKKDGTFKGRYEQRMPDYFRVLLGDKPALGISFSLIQNLGIDPLRNMQGQLLVAARLGESLKQALDVLKQVTLRPI